MRNLILLLSLFYTINARGQTLTAENFNPKIGDSFVYHFLNITQFITGNDGNWDFSALLPTKDTITCEIVANDDTLLFPESTCMRKNDIGTVFTYNYFITSDTALTGIGQKVDKSPFRYPVPLVFMSYPIKKGYTRTFVSSMMGITDSGTDQADATGTLITAFGTFTNTLRVHSTDLSFYQDTTIFDFYTWYTPGIHDNLLQIRKVTDPNKTVRISALAYKGPIPIPVKPIEEKPIGEIELFPNPTHGNVEIRLKSFASESALARISTQLGVVISEYPGLPAEFVLDFSTFASGVYILQLFDGKKLLRSFKIVRL